MKERADVLLKSTSTGVVPLNGGEDAPSKNRPKLLTVIPHLGAGGAERVVANLLAAMQPDLFEYHVVTLQPPQPGDRALPEHVTRWSLDVKRVETAGLALTRLLRRLKPDIVYSHIVAMNVVTAFAVGLSRTRARLVVVEHHAARSIVSNSGRPGLFHPLLMTAMGWFYPWADKIVGVSQAVLHETMQISRVDREKGVVIHNPVVFDDLVPNSVEPTGHPWLDEDGYEVVLGVGRLVHFKNYELLIDAFAHVAARRPNARLVIVGDGALRDRLQDRIDWLGLTSRAALVGYWPNPFRAMRRAAVVAVTSYTEGLSTVLIESMALGTPVVATDFASAREALPAGLVSPVAQTPQAVADGLIATLDDPGDRDGLRAFAADFTVMPIARRYEALFFEVLEARRHSEPETPEIVPPLPA